jgi:hypothetical protein
MIPKETIDRINAEAEKYGFVVPYNGSDKYYNEDKVKGYQAGATEWAGSAQDKEAWCLKRIKSLRDTLEQIIHAPVPANEREYMAWFVTAKNVAGGAISNDDAEIEVAGYNQKEATNG